MKVILHVTGNSVSEDERQRQRERIEESGGSSNQYTKIQFPPHKERIVSIIKIAHFSLFREFIAVCCKDHRETYKFNVWALKILLTFSMEQSPS